MNIAPFGIAVLISPFVIAVGLWLTRSRGSKWFLLLTALMVLAVLLAIATLYAIGGHVDSTSNWQ